MYHKKKKHLNIIFFTISCSLSSGSLSLQYITVWHHFNLVQTLLSTFLLSAQRRRLSDLQPNTESVGELWLGLLRFYTEEFDFKEHVISIRQKKRLTTFEKQWTSKCIAIEGAHTSSTPSTFRVTSPVCTHLLLLLLRSL